MEVIFFNFWFVQFIGIVGVLLYAYAFQSKNRKPILLFQSIGSLVFFLYYWLLSAYIGAVLNFIVIFRNLVSDAKTKHSWAKSKAWMYTFIILSLIALVFFWQGPLSILPALGIILGTYASWRDEPFKIRFFMLLATLVWVPYSIAIHAYSGLLSHFILLAFIFIGMYKHDTDKFRHFPK